MSAVVEDDRVASVGMFERAPYCGPRLRAPELGAGRARATAANAVSRGRASRNAHLSRRAPSNLDVPYGMGASRKLRLGGCARPHLPVLEVTLPKRSVNSSRSQVLVHRARTMRAEPTLSEAKLWACLAGSQLGVAFRRQVVVGERIVDFLAPARRLVVEVDGGYHQTRMRADARRDRELEALGYRVLRIGHARVLRDIEAVLAEIRRAIA